MEKYIGYLLYDEENKQVIEWCFVIKVKKTDKWGKLKDGTITIPYSDVIEFDDFIGEYDADTFYASDKDLHNTFNGACKDILREFWKGE